MRTILAGVLGAWLVPGAAAAQSSSAELAARLDSLLRTTQKQHIAAADPAEAGRFVSAMRVGEGTLFVISARYTQPSLLNEQIWRGAHDKVYVELNSASQRDGRLFVQDLGAPGLHATREKDRPFDIVYESATTRTAFDGDWKAQKLSKEAYQENFTRADKRYTHALEVLVGALTAKAEPTEAEK